MRNNIGSDNKRIQINCSDNKRIQINYWVCLDRFIASIVLYLSYRPSTFFVNDTMDLSMPTNISETPAPNNMPPATSSG